jgi:trehalose 6-phosphate phosphatase
VRAALYAGDDLADLEAFEALDQLALRGLAVVRVAVTGPETPPELIERSDLKVEGPCGLVDLLGTLP